MSDAPFSPNPEFDDQDDKLGSVDGEETHVVLAGPRLERNSDRYDLGQLFLEWAWAARFRDRHHGWMASIRALARTLRGLETAGLIERRMIRLGGRPTHHGFVLTERGHEALVALSGNWITEEPDVPARSNPAASDGGS